MSTTEGHRNYLENQHIYLEVTYRSNGPQASPAGTVLSMVQSRHVVQNSLPMFQSYGVKSSTSSSNTVTTSNGNVLTFGSVTSSVNAGADFI